MRSVLLAALVAGSLLFSAGPGADHLVEVVVDIESVEPGPMDDLTDIRAASADALRPSLAKLEAAGLTDIEPMSYSPSVIGKIEARNVENLRAVPGVLRVTPDTLGFDVGTNQSLPFIGQDVTSAAGERGSGATVVVIDTGLDHTQAAFGCTTAGEPGCPVIANFDTATDDGRLDDDGHGTNVAAIVNAVAPDADIVAIDVFKVGLFGKNLARNGPTKRALEWAIDNAERLNIVSVNMSLGGADFTQISCGWYNSEFQALRAVGVEPVVAAGNNGSKKRIAAPACSPYVTAVGAVHDTGNCLITGESSTAPDTVAAFSQSSRKLDMLAPGLCVRAGGATMSGTSQATPHVAGAFAVVDGTDPELTRAAIRRRLLDTGVAVSDTNGITRPRLALSAALGMDAGVPGWSEKGDLFGWAVAVGNFDGDQYADLAIGLPGETINGRAAAGGVVVLYGTFDGLDTAGAQLWNQAVPGVPGALEAGDGFGTSLAAGDFNNDGRDDLAVGSPGEDVGQIVSAGAVSVLYGSSSGLTTSNAWIVDGGAAGLPGAAEAFDGFGSVLAVGDFDGDSNDDLAIGVPSEAIGSLQAAGAVFVLLGDSGGLGTAGSVVLHQNVAGVDGAAESGDRFGSALAAGDINGDGESDLVVGIVGEDITGPIVDAGAIQAFMGGTGSNMFSVDTLIHQDTNGIRGVAERQDQFGGALAIADFDGDGFEDVAIGIRYEDLEAKGLVNAGAVQIVNGSAAGLSTADRIWTQDSAGIAGKAETGDQFGAALAAGGIRHSGTSDLAIGAPFEDVGAIQDAGAVNVLYGSDDGLTAAIDQIFSQDSTGILGVAETGDRFGAALAVGALKGSARGGLAIGVFGEAVGSTSNAGAVNVVYSGGPQLTHRTDQIWTEIK